ncbi:MAG TPA: FlgD immunoglobulin-like domain containing protein [Bacteroidota bacterium]
MFRRLLPLWCAMLSVCILRMAEAQDKSAMWNAAKRWQLGLDGPIADPANAFVTDFTTDNPPNTPDVAVFNPSANAQSENSIGVNPANPNQLMVSTNGRIPGSNPVVHQTWAFSSDGGATWPSQSEDLPPGVLDSFGDPVAFFDVSGRAYFSTLGSPGGLYFVSTTDIGATWSPRTNADLLNSTNDDKQHAAADHSGTFPNNVYIAWTDFGVTGTPVQFARSTNQGATWQPRVTLAIGSNRGQGVHISTGPNGEVYVVWAHYTTGTAEVGIGFAKSTDGGATFSTPVIAYPINGIRISNGGIAALNGVRASSFPYFDVDRSSGSRSGWIYVITPELVNGQADIFMRRSSDGGTTWSGPIQVNGPDVEAGKWQFMASIAVDQITGEISIGYYSMDSTGSNFMTNRYIAHSIDGGDTWDNSVISDVRANWQPQGTPNTNTTYNGDYYETTAWGGKGWAIWTDRRTGTNKAYVENLVYADPTDPNPPSAVSAFSDYTTPTSIVLRWTKPTTLVDGTPIGPYVVRVKRNGSQIAEVASTDSTYADIGLTDGTSYAHALQTRLLSNDSLSSEATTGWTAGGAKTPRGPTALTVSGTAATGYTIRWTNPSQQTDGTTLDDLAGIRLYRDGILFTTLTRTSADTARADSTTDMPPAGLHNYSVTAIDNEGPVNESAASNTGFTPLEIPFTDTFPTTGIPNTAIWVATNVDVTGGGINPPSPPNALNLNGNPTGGGDNCEVLPLDLSGLQGMGVALTYFYQPRGTGDNPELADSLIVEFLNSVGEWIFVRGYPGLNSADPVPPFAFQAVGVDGVSPGAGTFFYNGFKFRFRSKGTTGAFDDWYVDDVSFGIPTGSANIGLNAINSPSGQIANNAPVNPVVTITNVSAVTAGPFNVFMNITGPGTSYSSSQLDSNIAAGGSKTVTFSSAFTPDDAGQWSATAYTVLSGDPDATNDTLSTTFFAVNPISLPLSESFPNAGPPDPLVWTNVNTVVSADASLPPSTPNALNLAGNATGLGLDTITTLTINTGGLEGMGVTLAYWQQPQGLGDVPEAADSLSVEALNNLGAWIILKKLPGAPLRPFQFEQFNMDSVNSGGGSFFHSGFKFRFRSRSTTATTTRQDDWFVDDVFFGVPTGAPGMGVSPLAIADTVLEGLVDTSSYSFVVSNTNPFGTQLTYSIAETPSVAWLSVVPSSGSISGGSSNAISAHVNFTGITPGTYSTSLIVTSNDTTNSSDTVAVNFVVNAAPVVGLSPDSITASLDIDSTTTRTMTIRNIGAGPLTFDIAIEDAGLSPRISFAHLANNSYRGNEGRVSTKSGEAKSAKSRPRLPFIPGATSSIPDDADPSALSQYTMVNVPEGYPQHFFVEQTPDLAWYKFNEVGGLRTRNFANPATAINDSADILGSLTMGGTGQAGAALVGAGASSSTSYVNTSWATSLSGDWAISMWLNNLPSNTTLYYLWGDNTAGSFRCFLGGAAGAGNLLVRGAFTDVLITGVAPGPSIVDVIYDSAVPEIRAYVNGTLNNTVAQSLFAINGTGPFKVGGYSTSTGLSSGSLMDDFMLWNRIPSGVTWIVPDTLSGVVTAGDSVQILMTIDATGLLPGSYSASIQVLSNDPVTPVASIPAHLTVTGVPPPPPVTEKFADHTTSTMKVSVTNEGNIGSLNAFVGTGPGSGFQFNPVSTTGQRLFEGSLIIATDSGHVSNAARNNSSPEVFDADFKFNAFIDTLVSGIVTRYTTSYTDSLAENPLFIRVDQTSWSLDSTGLSNMLLMQLDITNSSASSISGITFGGFFDWDVDPATAQDRGQVVVDSTNTIPGVNGGTPFIMEMLELHQGASPTSWVGIVPLSENTFKARRISIQSTEVFPPHMTDGDKWLYVNTNRATNPNGDAGSNVDHSQFWGQRSFNLAAVATKRVGFAVVAGTSLADFVRSAREAQRQWVLRLGNAIDVITTDVVQTTPDAIPESYDLGQNYPNPFNPTTVIRYALPEPSSVTLKIYNVLGQQVAELVNDVKSAGFFQAQWNGRNQYGQLVSSGVYFYRMEAHATNDGNVFVSEKKMLMLK